MGEDIKNVKDELLAMLQQYDKGVDAVEFIALRVGAGVFKEMPARIIAAESPSLAWIADNLDFTYDAGHGSQELFGVVAFTDGTWLERVEYGGKENWAYKHGHAFHDVCAALRRVSYLCQ